MFSLLFMKLAEPQFLVMMLTGIAAAASVWTVAMPLFEGDGLSRRMKAVSVERDKIRARERERLAKTQQPGRRALQARRLARHGDGEEPARHGGLSRSAGRGGLPVLPPRNADRARAYRALLPLRPEGSRPAGDDPHRHGDRGRLSRRQGAGDLPLQHHQEAP